MACYMSEWNRCSPKTCKMLMIFMERAKRPIRFYAGNYFVLNLATLMAVRSL